ncbi:hypothetical protein QVM62_30780, partial [Pseudomonas putida]
MTKKMPALLPDHPMYTDAVDAMKQYHEAQASGSSAEEVERADSTTLGHSAHDHLDTRSMLTWTPD